MFLPHNKECIKNSTSSASISSMNLILFFNKNSLLNSFVQILGGSFKKSLLSSIVVIFISRPSRFITLLLFLFS